MRITSPKKYHGQFKPSTSHLSPKNKLSTLLANNLPTNKIHVLNSLSKHTVTKFQSPNTSYKSPNTKQKSYSNLKSKQLQYVELIRDLHEQNKILKKELGKLSHQESQSSILRLSPTKPQMNQTMRQNFNFNKTFTNTSNTHYFNSTFDNFNSYSKDISMRQNVSPFSKKPIVVQHITSPTVVTYSNGLSTIVVRPQPIKNSKSPFKMSCDNVLSSIAPKKSVEKKMVHHSYNPSLVSYQTPTPIQSLVSTPKKSFQSISGLNSQIFSILQHNQNKQNYEVQNPHGTDNIEVKILNNNFFDIKKRQVNYGQVFQKQKTNKKINHQTIIKMGSQKSLKVREDLTIKIQPIQQENPITSKRNKSLARDNRQSRQKSIEKSKNHSNQIKQQFNLQQNINKNPLMSLLKIKLQKEFQEQQNARKILENQTNSLQQDQNSFKMASVYNHNIRYNSDVPEVNAIQSIHPLRRNILQGFGVLNSLNCVEVANSQPLNQNNCPSNHEAQQSASLYQQKISKEHFSQLLIQQVNSCPRTPTIVRMLRQTEQQNQQKYDQSFSNAIQESQRPVQYSMNLVQMVNQMPFNSQHQLFQSKNIQISNRYYCQETLHNQSEIFQRKQQMKKSKGQQRQNQISQSQMKKSQHKKVQINQQKNIQTILESQKLLNQLKCRQNQNSYQANEDNYRIQSVLNSEEKTEKNQFKIRDSQIRSECPSQKSINQSQYSLAQSHKSKMNESSEYQLFYKKSSKQTNQKPLKYKHSSYVQPNKKPINQSNQPCDYCNCQLFNNFQKQQNNFMRKDYHMGNKVALQHPSSQCISSSITLRSQKFKKISNKAYL